MKTRIITAAAVCFVISTSAGAQSSVGYGPGVAQTCDRACLVAFVDAYLEALVAHDPRRVPISPDARFVENAVSKPLGAGLWQTAAAVPTTFRIYVPDPVSAQIGFLGLMEEDGGPVQIGLRLEIEDGSITEIEHLLARNLSESSLANLQAPRSGLLRIVPPEDRVSRDAMLDIGYSYYVALQGANGSAAPFADDCQRRENGMQTTGNPPPTPDEEPGFSYFGSLGCAEQLDTRIMSYIARIDERRVEIADVETGLVFGLSHFRHPMESKTLRIFGVPGIETWEMSFDPFDLPAAHVFKISGGEIHEIEAIGFMLPYDSPSGWE